MKRMSLAVLLLSGCVLPVASPAQAQATPAATSKPNIVFVFLDNFGWGEPGFNGGGIIRGTPTPRMDQIANEGLRLTNFNVEVQCTPSRSALMTGRYPDSVGVPGVVRLYPLLFLLNSTKSTGER